MPRIISGMPSEDESRVMAFDDFPVSKSNADSDVGEAKSKVVHVIERPSLSSLHDSMERIGKRCGRKKPAYADTWIIGSSDFVDVLERYDTDSASVVIGNADDGEVEYNVTPNEYGYPSEIVAMIGDAIEDVRGQYRKSGGSMDRNRVLSSASAFFESNVEKLESMVSGCSVADAVTELCGIVCRYTLGLGIFDVLLADPRIEDIYIDAPCDKNRIHVTLNQVNGYNSHVRCRTNLIADEREVRNLISVLMRESGLPFCESNPVIETDMCDGTARATVVGYPMSPNGNSVAIRKHSTMPWTLSKLIGNGTVDARTAGLLSFLVDNRCTFLICGARGAGKSSLLSSMMFEFPISQRILTIEDTLELPGDKMRKMGYKVQSMLIDERMDGDANKRADEALRVSLRLGESAIVLGEVRGDETRTLYQSMRTGRAGSSIMGTIHGDSSKTVYERVVHDLQIAPEAFMATDFLITMGTVRLRGSDKQTRMVSEMVSTSDKIGSFIDITADTGLFRSPAIKRIMKSTGMTKKDIIEEIGIRAEMRSFLAEMAQSHGVGFYGPEWIALANDHLGKCISSGTMEKDEVMDSFRNRFKRFSEAI